MWIVRFSLLTVSPSRVSLVNIEPQPRHRHSPIIWVIYLDGFGFVCLAFGVRDGRASDSLDEHQSRVSVVANTIKAANVFFLLLCCTHSCVETVKAQTSDCILIALCKDFCVDVLAFNERNRILFHAQPLKAPLFVAHPNVYLICETNTGKLSPQHVVPFESRVPLAQIESICLHLIQFACFSYPMPFGAYCLQICPNRIYPV